MKKLHALANNNENEFEAKSALKKLEELLKKNNLTMAEFFKLL
jgi:hypothetical protein